MRTNGQTACFATTRCLKSSACYFRSTTRYYFFHIPTYICRLICDATQSVIVMLSTQNSQRSYKPVSGEERTTRLSLRDRLQVSYKTCVVVECIGLYSHQGVDHATFPQALIRIRLQLEVGWLGDQPWLKVKIENIYAAVAYTRFLNIRSEFLIAWVSIFLRHR